MANPTLLVSNFGNSLALTDASGAGTWTGVNPVRYDDGLWVEQATTNLTRQSSGGVVANWQCSTANGTIASNAVVTRLSGYNISLTRTGVGILYGQNTEFSVVTEALPYALTMHAQSPDIAQINIELRWLNAGVSHISTDSLGLTAIDSDDWTELILLATAPAGATYVLPQFYAPSGGANDDVVYVADVQLEQRSYATSSATGAMGDGYAWTGTAHNSTSTRAASSASVDPTDRIDPASGSIAFRYTRLIDTGGEEIILTCGNKAASEDYLEIGIDANDDLYMEWDSDNAGAERVTSTFGNIAVDTEYFFYADWDGTTIRLSVNNGALDSDTRDAAQGSWGAGELVLTAPEGSHVVGPFGVFDRKLVTDEITKIDDAPVWRFDMLVGTPAHVLLPRFNIRNNALVRR